MRTISFLYRSVLDRLSSVEGKSQLIRQTEAEFSPQENPFAASFGNDDQPPLFEVLPTDHKSVAVFAKTSVSLDQMHRAKYSRNRLTFRLSLLTAGITLGIVMVVLLRGAFFGGSYEIGSTIIKLWSTALPTLLTATLFFLYKTENANLAALEKDIRYINKVESTLQLVQKLPDDATKREIILKLFEKVQL